MRTLADRDVAVFWHPASQMRDYEEFPPLEIVGARGARLVLADGREILDAISSWWCKSLGHGHPKIRARVEAQLGQFEHVIAANTTHEDLVELCERLLALANPNPDGGGRRNVVDDGPTPALAAEPGRRSPVGHFTKVFLTESGSGAVEVAFKMALHAQALRGRPERRRLASFAGGYHGETVGTLSIGDLGLYGDPYRSLMFPVTKLGPLPDRTGPGDPRWLDAQPEWDGIERALDALAPELAAIVYEPLLQAAGGMRFYSPDLLRRLRSWATEHGVYLIADEIAAGMGRLGAMLASHLVPGACDAGQLPDLAVLSKGLTGGFMPLAAVLATEDIYRLFDGDWTERRAFLHSSTYAGHALAVAAGLGALDAYATEDVLANVSDMSGLLAAEMQRLAATRPAVGAWRAFGLVGAVDLRQPNGAALDPATRTGYRVYREAVRRGALLRPLGDTMYVFPPLNVSRADLQAMTRILEDSILAVLPD